MAHIKDTSAAKEEILAGSREAAASIAMGTRKRSSIPFPSFGKSFKLRVLLIAIIVFLIGSLGAFTYLKLFTGSTYQSETINIVEGVQELATLATAQAVVTTVIKEEDNKLFNKEISVNFPGTKRTVLLIVPATVLAGVDLQTVTDENFVIDEENKEIKLTLPHAALIQDPSINMDKVQTYSEEGLFRSEVKWDEGYDLAAKAQTEIIKEAENIGLLTKAEDSAVKVLSHFFQQLGYEARVEFK
ncbi:DUF4230 domain-containing protein [Cytobacillus solani]|uniref:DUF4230 domain-containing protein n=1 Tax=Cytobacillus solani TaxID=1637975 RepID=A0A0Q3VKA3_9BACI|nr:DUF4230 domain-containing protein [Cytobacillus solani]KQL21603.1 hypothetical protein AN957_25625 [Cytobacillus solani]